MYIYIIYQKRKRSKTPTETCVVGAQSNEEKCVFCVFEGTRKSTKKKRPRAGREEEGGHFSQKQGKKEHQKLIKKQLFSLTHSLISFFSRRGVVRFIIFFYIKREKTYVIYTHTHTHTRFENTKRISLENHSD
jgi:hypothetical protein